MTAEPNPQTPAADHPLPETLHRLAAGRPTRPVWLNGEGGITVQVLDPERPFHAKWSPAGAEVDCRDEAERMRWLHERVAVPEVLDAGSDASGSWLTTVSLPGCSVVDPRWKGAPEKVIRAAGEGLRRLHSVDPSHCPWSWRAADRVAALEREGKDTSALPPMPPEDLVVCQGDPCMPNTLVDESGTFLALVDLARVGVADRWADLTVGAWSLSWNFGTGWDATYFDAYGITPDWERIRYYKALWNLESPPTGWGDPAPGVTLPDGWEPLAR